MPVRAGEHGLARSAPHVAPSDCASTPGTARPPRRSRCAIPVRCHRCDATVGPRSCGLRSPEGIPIVGAATALGSAAALAPQAARRAAGRVDPARGARPPARRTAGRQRPYAGSGGPSSWSAALVSRRLRWLAVAAILADPRSRPDRRRLRLGSVERNAPSPHAGADRPPAQRMAGAAGSDALTGRTDRRRIPRRPSDFLASFDERPSEPVADVVAVGAAPDRAVGDTAETDGERCFECGGDGEHRDQRDGDGRSVEHPGDRCRAP